MSGLLQGLVWAADFTDVDLNDGTKQRQTVSSQSKAILARLADACNDYGVGVRNLSKCAIATDIMCKPDTVKKAISLWRKLGVLKIRENDSGGRGNYAIYDIDVAEVVACIPANRMPAGLQNLAKRVVPTVEKDDVKGGATSPLSEKGGAGRPKGGRSTHKKGGAGYPPTNTKESNKYTNPAAADPSAPDGDGRPPPEQAPADNEAPDDAKRRKAAEERILLRWLKDGEIGRLEALPLVGPNKGFLRQEATDFALAIDGASFNRVASFVRWAMQIEARTANDTEPIPPVIELLALREEGSILRKSVCNRCDLLMAMHQARSEKQSSNQLTDQQQGEAA